MRAAASLLDARQTVYDPAIFIEYTRRIIEEMGGAGEGVALAAREIYDEWSACHHFELYDDVPEVLRVLHGAGMTIGLISNTQRSLIDFQSHFALEGLISVTVSSSDHGYLKPHPSIFEEALRQVGAAPPKRSWWATVRYTTSTARDGWACARFSSRGRAARPTVRRTYRLSGR